MLVGCTLTSPLMISQAHSTTATMPTAVFSPFPLEEVRLTPLSLASTPVSAKDIRLQAWSTQVRVLPSVHEYPTKFRLIGECYCGNALINGAVKGTESDCNMACSGSAS
jgi:hypothetical protein